MANTHMSVDELHSYFMKKFNDAVMKNPSDAEATGQGAFEALENVISKLSKEMRDMIKDEDDVKDVQSYFKQINQKWVEFVRKVNETFGTQMLLESGFATAMAASLKSQQKAENHISKEN
jgi:enamine deaminase RidA (YjgF/YER057c/UK114 family)